MKGQLIRAIYAPETVNDWYVLETEEGKYELVLGGFRPTHLIISDKLKIDSAALGGEIKRIKTDALPCILSF